VSEVDWFSYSHNHLTSHPAPTFTGQWTRGRPVYSCLNPTVCAEGRFCGSK